MRPVGKTRRIIATCAIFGRNVRLELLSEGGIHPQRTAKPGRADFAAP